MCIRDSHDTLLGLVGDRRGVLSVDDHARAHRHGARGLRLGERRQGAIGSGCGNVDETLAAGAHRIQTRVVTEPRDLDAGLFGGAADAGARGHAHRSPLSTPRSV